MAMARANRRVKPKATAKTKPEVRPKPKAKAKAKTKAKPKALPKAAPRKQRAALAPAAKPKAPPKAAPRKQRVALAPARGASRPVTDDDDRQPDSDAIPHEIDDVFSTTGRRRARTAREWSTRSSPVVEILDDPYPIGALRRFLDSIKGPATEQQTQIALGSAQLMLLPIARESRGGPEVKELVDLVLERWADWGELRSGFHAQEFLRNAFAAVGVDRPRISRLEAHVPEDASSELLFDLAAAHAVARDKVAMLRATEAALDAGASAAEFRRDADFAPYTNDPDLAALLARADLPAIPVDLDPHLLPVRRALDSLVNVIKELGGSVELRPPVRLDAILDAERAAKLALPNDYRALLTITNGMRLWDRDFLGIADYREHSSPLAVRAQQFLHAEYASAGLSDCVPLASWGQPNDWLLYDPRGRIRGGAAGYVVVLGADEVALEDLTAALVWLEELARDILGTN